MEKEEKRKYWQIAASLLLCLLAWGLPFIWQNEYCEVGQWLLFFIAYCLVGADVIQKAIENLLQGEFLDEHFLMTLATFGAIVTQEYPEAVMVMLLYQVGECFQDRAVEKSKDSIADLMKLRPDCANVKEGDTFVEKDPKEVKIGEVICVKPGEKVPLDGLVIEGESLLDTVALTGESVPRSAKVGMEVASGCINQTSPILMKVTKRYEESTVSKILELVEHASERKAKTENWIHKFARYYTPIVVVAALALAFVPPLIWQDAEWFDYLQRACSFLVISCPCALVISIPLTFFSGMGGASKKGVLIKGSNYIEALAKTRQVLLDKTGTITKGTFEVTEIHTISMKQETLLEMAALAETYSEHPIANSIRKAYGKEIETQRLGEVKESSGHGVCSVLDGKKVYVGNAKLMAEANISEEAMASLQEKINSIGTMIYVAYDSELLGVLVIADEIKPEAKQAIERLKQHGISQLTMLTGDHTSVAEAVAKEVGIPTVQAELLPEEKVHYVESQLQKKAKEDKILFVGDGLNDAPVLMRADVGMAMGGLGSEAAIEAADVVIMDDDITKIDLAIRLSQRTLHIVKQNIAFALGIKLLILVLGAFGIATMWEAVFADVGVSILAILNAMRAMRS